jgi:hypothetical protein
MWFISWQDSTMVSFLTTKMDAWRPNCIIIQMERNKRFAMVVPLSPLQQEYKEFMYKVDVTSHYPKQYLMQL